MSKNILDVTLDDVKALLKVAYDNGIAIEFKDSVADAADRNGPAFDGVQIWDDTPLPGIYQNIESQLRAKQINMFKADVTELETYVGTLTPAV